MMVSKRRASGSVRHSTETKMLFSRPALVMKALLPWITHSSPSRTARVRIAAVSEPASGSVMAAAVTASPRATGSTPRAAHPPPALPVDPKTDPAGGIPLRRLRRNLLAGELADGATDRLLLVVVLCHQYPPPQRRGPSPADTPPPF